MNNALLIKSLLASAVALALLAIPSPADAQRSAEDRQARREARQAERAVVEAEAMFPNATRESPEASMPPRLARRLQDFDQMLEGPENAQAVIDEANAIIGERSANAYVKSFAYMRMADAHDELEDWDSSFQALERALEEDGFGNDNHYLTMLRLGQNLVIEGRTEEGLQWVSRFVEETRTEKPEHLALLGNVYYQAERYPEAAEALRRAIDASPEPQANWNQLLMASLAEAGQDDEAVAVAARIVEQNPDDKRAVLNYVSVLMQADDYEKAAEVMDQARERGVLDQGQEYRQLASLYLNIEGREGEAGRVLKDGFARGALEENHDNYFLMGQAYYFAEDNAEAIQAWTKAAEHAPDGETALNLSKLHYEEGNWRQAKTLAQQALDRGVRNAEDARNVIRNADNELSR